MMSQPTSLKQAMRIIAELKAALDARQAVVSELKIINAQLMLKQADAALANELKKEAP